MENIKKIRKGNRRCFVGETEIQTPQNHGYPITIFESLLEQAGFTIKEWNGNTWIDLKSNNLKLLRRHGSY